MRGVALEPLAGIVLGPGDVPLAGARVEIPWAAAAAATDARGRFAFAGLPAEPVRTWARITAGDRQLDVEIERPEDHRPVVIRFDQLLED
jgi:hypothetical protein